MRGLLLAFGLIALGTTVAAAATLADVAGPWKHPDNGAIINFHDCDGDLCANIQTPSDPNLKDDKNPDASRRATPLTGLLILDHAKKSDDTSWKGNLYNTEDGKTYAGYISLVAPDKLQLKGCALLVFCKSVVFSKVAQ